MVKGSKKTTLKREDKIIKAALKAPTLSQASIAKLSGTDQAYVSRVLAKRGINLDEVKEFKDTQGFQELSVMDKIIKQIHKKSFSKESIYQLTGEYNIFKQIQNTNQGTNNPSLSININFNGSSTQVTDNIKTIEYNPNDDK